MYNAIFYFINFASKVRFSRAKLKIINTLTGWHYWRIHVMEWIKFQPSGLMPAQNYAKLISAGLDNQLLSRRIRHPQAVRPKATERLIIPYSATLALAFIQNAVFGGMGREPKNTPPSVPCFGGHCLAATRSALSEPKDKAFKMIYTFIIAQPWQKISQLKRVRTVSACGRTEAEARKALSGLPLVLKSRTPDKKEDAA